MSLPVYFSFSEQIKIKEQAISIHENTMCVSHQSNPFLNIKVMVTDFGLSDYEEDLRPDSAVCGTATYLAPEVSICVSGSDF